VRRVTTITITTTTTTTTTTGVCRYVCRYICIDVCVDVYMHVCLFVCIYKSGCKCHYYDYYRHCYLQHIPKPIDVEPESPRQTTSGALMKTRRPPNRMGNNELSKMVLSYALFSRSIIGHSADVSDDGERASISAQTSHPSFAVLACLESSDTTASAVCRYIPQYVLQDR
jgi:hypothetical protein